MKRRVFESGSEKLKDQGIWRVVKRFRDSLSGSPNPVVRALGQTLSFAGRLLHFARNRRYRSEIFTRLRRPGQHIQGSTFTMENRYPDLFKTCADLLVEIPEPVILSFGCSTGEEVRSLARIMPNAWITGIDINAWCLKEGRRKTESPRCTFLHRDSAEFAAFGGCNAIFCLAVFQRTEHRTKDMTPSESGFTFDEFERQLRMLDTKLTDGGLLFIDHADFRFEDTEVAQHYDSVPCPANEQLRERKLFGQNNDLIAEKYLAHRVFRKRRVIDSASRPEPGRTQ